MKATTGTTRDVIGWVPRHSELRRPSDRLEVTARWVPLILGLLLVLVALTHGSETTARLPPRVAIQHAEPHQVVATVLSVPAHLVSTRPDAGTEDVRAPVRWTAADGSARKAVVRVSEYARPGDTKVLWVDRSTTH